MKKNKLTVALMIGVILLGCAFINLNSLFNYSLQIKPAYIVKNNTPPNNHISDKGATLGRILFYDKKLSANNKISCSSCHLQQFAFGDTATLSQGFNGGLTARHAMRLTNARFSVEQKFFWDERAATLEMQTTQPIRNDVEMGYSGTNGQADLNSLINKLRNVSYYPSLFQFVFGDTAITEHRMQLALAQFIRSIQSFDSKFDAGLSQTNNINVNFPNYTALENQGKTLFLSPPPAGGAGCQGCHRAPEFDIDPNSKNNGIIGVAGVPGLLDLNNTKAPSLRNLFNQAGQLNGPMMHNGSKKTIDAVINHYNAVPQPPSNTNLDPRLNGPGGFLNLTNQQKQALVAFLQTLTGSAVYTDPKWSNPFEADGNLFLSTGIDGFPVNDPLFTLYPNPAVESVQLTVVKGDYVLSLFDVNGRMVINRDIETGLNLDVSNLSKGTYYLVLRDNATGLRTTKKLVKE